MSSRIVACRSDSAARGGTKGAAASGTIAPVELLGNIKRSLQERSNRCMLFVALNRTELRSRNEPIFKSPSVNTHGLLVAAAHRYVRFGGSTPSNPHVSVHLCDVRTDSKFDLVSNMWCPLLRGNCRRNKQLL